MFVFVGYGLKHLFAGPGLEVPNLSFVFSGQSFLKLLCCVVFMCKSKHLLLKPYCLTLMLTNARSSKLFYLHCLPAVLFNLS